jgi:TPR repeat protein
MKFISTKRFRQRGVAAALGLIGLVLSTSAATADKPVAADQASDGLVHCLLPGQVRRLGAFSTSVTPRRATRLTPAQCQAGGGEYVEPQDHSAAVKMWLPMAAEGIPEAQTTVGELFDQRGDRAMAKSWYEKAAAQGDARSLINLAGFLEQSAFLAAAKGMSSLDTINRVSDLINKATGGLVAGLSIQRADRLRVDFVSPLGAAPMPRATGAPVVYESPAGPLDVVVRVAGAAALKSVRVNGQVQKPDAQGLLNIPVTVGDARTTLLVQAEDESGQQAQAELTLLQRSAPMTAAAASGAAPSITAALDLAPPAAGGLSAKPPIAPRCTRCGHGVEATIRL